MQDDQKSKAELLQELDSLRRRVSKLTQVEEKLKQYQFMVESAYDAIFFKDLKSRYVIANNKALEAFGLSREQVIGKNDYEIMPNKDEARKNIEDDNLVFKTGKLTKITKHMTGTDGKERWFHAIKVPQFDDEGNITGLIGIARDITECKKAEGELRESEERYRTLYETTRDGMAGGPMDGRILECNQAFADMLGYSKAELCNLTYQEITPERWHQMEAKIVEEQILKRGYSDEYEKEYIRKDGTVFPISARVWLRKDKDGKSVGMWGIVRDITEHKRAEEALRESEHQKRAILDSTPDLAWLKDKEGIYIAANEPLCEAFGVKLEDLVGKTDFDISPEDLAKKYRADDEKVMKCGNRKRVVEPWGKKKGKRIWMETIKTPIYNDSGELIGTSGIARDITERKRAEESLRESEHQKRAILDSTPDLAWLKDKEGIYIAANEPLCEAFGVKLEDLVGKTDFDISPEDLAKKYRADDEKVMKCGNRKRVVEPWGKKKGKRIWMETIKTPIYNDSGELIGTSGIARDITESKKAEEELRESEERFRAIFDNAADGILLADPESKRFHIGNKVMVQMLGCKPEEIKNLGVMDIHPEEDLPYVIEQFEKQLGGEFTLSKDIPVKRKDGGVFYADVNSVTVTFKGKTYLMGIFRDVTERKKAEDALRESEKKYRKLFEETTDAIFVADAETGIITDCNHAAAELVGREKSELIGKHQHILHPPEEIEGEFSRTFKQHLEEKEGQVLEAQVITKQGKIKDVAIRAGLIELEGKKRIQAMFRDITESKQREKELNLYREKMARAEQLASVGTLSATLAHELTQPLTVVNLSIENALAKLERTPSAATAIKNIEDSLTEVSNITSIVNRFRNYARRSSKRIVGEVDLKAVAERTVQLLSASARQARVTLRLESMDKLPHIYASEKDIEQLFFALVENAVQAADGKKDSLLIIGGDVKEGRIELRFCDDCGGIEPENLDKIFEPFFTTRPAGEGTGLGLCIVQDVVSRARGKVRVESQAGKGTTFFVTLPINKGEQS
jgi:PAS domain S-box-containing protein